VFSQSVWAHSQVGENGDPSSKIEAFKANIRNGIGNRADIVALKFCFWDIRSFTDVGKVFDDYRQAVSELKREYPRLVFVHFTVPLMSYPTGLGAKVRRVLGMPVGFDQDNIKRNELNGLVLNEYGGKEPVVDVALSESRLPSGERTFFMKGGQPIYYLAAAYTDDGGHLNEASRQLVAAQILNALAHASDQPLL
jgi:hypothetical protein